MMDKFKEPTRQAIGAAGVQYAASQLLRHGFIPSIPMLDIGYDLISDYDGMVKRLQVKSSATPERRSEKHGSCRFNILRRKTGLSTELGYYKRPKVHYDRSQLDAMVFVDLHFERAFVVPSERIDFSKSYITFRQDSEWLNAWWVLQQQEFLPLSPKLAKPRAARRGLPRD